MSEERVVYEIHIGESGFRILCRGDVDISIAMRRVEPHQGIGMTADSELLAILCKARDSILEFLNGKYGYSNDDRSLLASIDAALARTEGRCSVSFAHPPHDLCDGTGISERTEVPTPCCGEFETCQRACTPRGLEAAAKVCEESGAFGCAGRIHALIGKQNAAAQETHRGIASSSASLTSEATTGATDQRAIPAVAAPNAAPEHGGENKS